MPAHSFDQTPIYFLDAVRTSVGSPFKSLKDFSATQLGAVVMKGLVSRLALDPAQIDEVVFGNTVMAGEGENPARLASLLAGLPFAIPAFTVNHVCAAGLQSVIIASQTISLGHSQLIIAGGMESATRTPNLFSKLIDEPFSERAPVDSLIYDGLWCAWSGKHLGQLCEDLAAQEKISRSAQDQYAFESHQKARTASKEGKFSSETVAVILQDGKKFAEDERLRRVTLENLQMLPPAFAQDAPARVPLCGTITSGNASIPADGAAAVLIAGEKFVKKEKAKPLGRLVGYASIAVEPEKVFTAAVPAVEQCLAACGLKMKDIDLFEISEAFAAQAIYTRDKLHVPTDKMNINGGDVAFGHALGAAGTRILVTLLHSLKRENKKRGLAVICLGGGGAVAVVVESLK